MNRELYNLAESIRSIRLTERLSDEAVTALSRSYVSLQNLAVAHGVSDYGSRRELASALDKLYRICAKRCGADQPYARRCRMTPVLYMIVYMQMGGVDMRKSCECNELMYALVDEWMQGGQRDVDEFVLCDIMRCISNLYIYVPAQERGSEPEFVRFGGQIAAWASTAGADGRWEGLSDVEALCRLEVMGRNSNMFLDTSNDGFIETSRMSYCNSVLSALRRADDGRLHSGAQTLFMLYEVLMWGVGAPESELADIVAGYAGRLAERYPRGSGERLMCEATALDRLCMQAGDEIRSQLFANIA